MSPRGPRRPAPLGSSHDGEWNLRAPPARRELFLCGLPTLEVMISHRPKGLAEMAKDKRGTVRDRIVDAALELAEERGWANVRLYQVAERAEASLAAIGAEFRDLDALAN